PELSHQCNAFRLVGAAFLLKDRPQEGEGHAPVRDAKHHDIQWRLSQVPVSAVHCYDPGGGHSQEPHDKACHLCIRQLKEPKKTLHSLVVRLSLSTSHEDIGYLREVDGSNFNQGDDEASQKVDACSIPRYILVKRALQEAHVGHCARVLSRNVWRQILIRIAAQWPFMQFQRSFFVLY